MTREQQPRRPLLFWTGIVVTVLGLACLVTSGFVDVWVINSIAGAGCFGGPLLAVAGWRGNLQ